MWLEKEILNKKKLGVVLCDAGGTHHIISLIEKFKLNPSYYCEGPSLEILNKTKPMLSLSKFIGEHDLILTSSSWSSNIELKAIIEARKMKKKTFTVLDHLANFNNRFLLHGEATFPDSIILFDKSSFTKSKEVFKNYNINLYQCKSNYFLDKFLGSVIKIKKNNNCILYIDEPIRDHYEKVLKKKIEFRGFNEFTGLDFFIKNIKDSRFKNFNIDIKLHPSSKSNKYDYLKHPKVQILNPKTKLERIISAYNIVVGFESMALYLASKIRPRVEVYSLIPPFVKEKNIFNLNSFYEI